MSGGSGRGYRPPIQLLLSDDEVNEHMRNDCGNTMIATLRPSRDISGDFGTH